VGAPDCLTCAGQVAGTWIPMTTTAAPSARQTPLLYWTGSELFVYGGSQLSNVTQDGYYAPCADSWRPSPMRQYGAPGGVAGVEGSGEIFYFRPEVSQFVAFDYVANRASDLSLAGASLAQASAVVFTGSELLTWSGATLRASNNGYDGTTAGSIYNPQLDAWRPMTTVGAPSARTAPAAWTGSRLIVWGGRSSDSVQTSAGRSDCISTLDLPGCPVLADGGFYDVAADRWTPILSSAGAPAGRRAHLVAWTGSRVLVWGGRTASDQAPYGSTLIDGGLYDESSASWQPTAAAPFSADAVSSSNTFWTGHQLIVDFAGTTAWSYDSDADRWTAIAGLGDATLLCSAPSVQAGALVGICNASKRVTVRLLTPGATSWRLFDLPAAAWDHPGFLWTGKRLFVWGGTTTVANPCQNVPPGTGCDPPPPPTTNMGWMMVP